MRWATSGAAERADTTLHIELEREDDGRPAAEVPEAPGCLVYETSAKAGLAAVQALALRILAGRIDHGEQPAAAMAIGFKPVDA